MAINNGFLSEDEFDNSVDFDPTFLSELDQAEQSIPTNKSTTFKPTATSSQFTSPYPVPPPSFIPPSSSSVRPGHLVLRPPVPPPLKRARLSSAAPTPSQTQSPAAKQWVHPNPFIKHPKLNKVADVVEVDDDDDEDAPMIIMGSGGYQVEASVPPVAQSSSVGPPLRTKPPSIQPLPPPRAPVRTVQPAQPPARASVAPVARAGSMTPVAAPTRPSSAHANSKPPIAAPPDPSLAKELEALRREKENVSYRPNINRP